jgi:hypothetical protein
MLHCPGPGGERTNKKKIWEVATPHTRRRCRDTIRAHVNPRRAAIRCGSRDRPRARGHHTPTTSSPPPMEYSVCPSVPAWHHGPSARTAEGSSFNASRETSHPAGGTHLERQHHHIVSTTKQEDLEWLGACASPSSPPAAWSVHQLVTSSFTSRFRYSSVVVLTVISIVA